MEASPLPTSSSGDWANQFAETLNQQRDRVQDFLVAQQARIEHAEKELEEQLQQIGDETVEDRRQTKQASEEIQQRSEQIARETETLEALKQELATRQAEWEELRQGATEQQEALAEQFQRQQAEFDRRHQELAAKQVEIAEAGAELRQERKSLELSRNEHQARVDQLATQREQLDAQQAELDAGREKLAVAESETESQRRRIAREFKGQHAAHLKELDRRRAELEQRETAERDELQRQLETAKQRETELSDELESLCSKGDQLQRQLGERIETAEGDAGQLADVLAERDGLLAQVAEVESQLKETERRLDDASSSEGGGQADEDLQRRYEMAMDDVRELKASNAELQEKLDRAPAAEAAPSGGGLDWEAEKQRLLASLDDDFDEDNEEDQAERLKIEEVIENTDRILAVKDREIVELKQLLEDQSASVGSMAVGPAALGEVLDNDAIVQEERENLTRLQAEWEEKLRKAEIDISVERAKMARERAEIDEKLQVLERRAAQAGEQSGEQDKSGKPARGKWLARLGLKDGDSKEK